MPRYRYTACDSLGAKFGNELEAATETEARQILESRGFKVDELVSITPAASAALSAEESQQVTGRLAQLTASSLPLAAGLRAAADECGSRRVADAMHDIASRVENGQSLEEVIASSGNLFPPHVAGLVLAATKTGKLGAALSELLEHQRATRNLRRSITRGFAYPLLVVCLAAVVLLIVILGVSEPYLRLFNDFDLELPLSTRLLIWWREFGLAIASCIAAGSIALVILLRLVLPRTSWSRIIAGIPIFGPLAHWTALAEWCSLLSVLVKNRIALPEALRLSAAGIENAYVGQIAKELGERTAAGQSLSELLATNRPLPVSLVPLVRWGERVGALDEAFGTARELFDRRVRVRALMLQSILPPILFVLIACSVVMVIGALFAPLTNLITGLS
ncbi:MAG TPA: type II secretion system F family protein [Pirellulaceae bacterium]|nr:type II secretion system F family protein [Pirellulaceae bacterium]